MNNMLHLSDDDILRYARISRKDREKGTALHLQFSMSQATAEIIFFKKETHGTSLSCDLGFQPHKKSRIQYCDFIVVEFENKT